MVPAMSSYRILRLGSNDAALAKRLFIKMADIFDEARAELSERYLSSLLARTEFWALAALAGDEVVGGLTAHTLPMTRLEASEIFIYDIAVDSEHRLKGVGRQLIAELQRAAGAAGIQDAFVPVDNDDQHALDFYRALGASAAPVTIFSFGAGTDAD
jgi:aminoglycoside 3-N-acetyltransferase I